MVGTLDYCSLLLIHDSYLVVQNGYWIWHSGQWREEKVNRWARPFSSGHKLEVEYIASCHTPLHRISHMVILSYKEGWEESLIIHGQESRQSSGSLVFLKEGVRDLQRQEQPLPQDLL